METDWEHGLSSGALPTNDPDPDPAQTQIA